MLQAGVLRTNCIDCLDRTNVAQYAYGLAALGRQLQVLGFIESPYVDLDNPLAKELMTVYESMGDKLAFQYGGSAAHNKVIFLPFVVWTSLIMKCQTRNLMHIMIFSRICILSFTRNRKWHKLMLQACFFY